MTMLGAFGRVGGIHHWRKAGTSPSSRQAERQATISATPMISFEWDGDLWVPAFQFDPIHRVVGQEVAAVVTELETAFNAWDLAAWFVKPNLWLAEARPVDLMACSPTCVLGAARADRFIAMG